MKDRNSTKKLIQIALLSCVGTLLMIWQVSFPSAPFLKIEISDVPVLIGTFSMGPAAGAAILLIKNLLFAVIKFCPDELIGLPMNFISTLVLLLVASWFYNRRKCWQSALLGLSLGMIASTAVMIPVNMFITPIYLRVFAPHFPIPRGRDLLTFILATVVPFNAVKGILNVTLTFLVYKRVSALLRPGEEMEMPVGVRAGTARSR